MYTCCAGVVLELCWSYAGVMLELCWSYAGVMFVFFFVIDGFIMI